jgi:HD-GYP domain-containing protein (c-di-GMP phosphodiesterase class II)
MKIKPGRIIEELITAITFVTDVEGDKRFYHAWRVATIATRLAEVKAFKINKIKNIFYAALLHDIGAVGLPHHILYYLERPDRANYNTILSHPIIGSQLTWLIPTMDEPAKLILDHHEWFSGEGYPRGKITTEIPLGSQIIRIADFIDIKLQNRRYQNLKILTNKINEAAGKEFSRELAKVTMNTLKKKRFFHHIAKKKNIPKLFYETKSNINGINIKKGVDAIGLTLEVIAQIIDMKHPYSAGHSLRVSRYAMAIALAMNLSHDEITMIKWAGLLHDIGKVTVSRKILDKSTSLTKGEFKEVSKHPKITEDIMGLIPSLKEITPIAANHHEYFNGSGYPNGLKENEIPFEARILCICDCFDAMTSNRPYRHPLTPQMACREIQKLSGIQFDPKIVKEAIPILRNLSV